MKLRNLGRVMFKTVWIKSSLFHQSSCWARRRKVRGLRKLCFCYTHDYHNTERPILETAIVQINFELFQFKFLEKMCVSRCSSVLSYMFWMFKKIGGGQVIGYYMSIIQGLSCTQTLLPPLHLTVFFGGGGEAITKTEDVSLRFDEVADRPKLYISEKTSSFCSAIFNAAIAYCHNANEKYKPLFSLP